jgi:hypothetical protein
MDRMPPDVPRNDIPQPDETAPLTPPPADDDGSWGFLPLILGLAALCLALFFFLSPPPDTARQTSAKTDQNTAPTTPAPGTKP